MKWFNNIDFFRPPEDSPEMKYLRERAKAMGGPLPARKVKPIQITAPPLEIFKDALAGSRRPRSLHHRGFRRRPEEPDEASGTGQAGGAHRAG